MGKAAVAEENINQSMKDASEKTHLSIMVLKTLAGEEDAGEATAERPILKDFRRSLEKKIGRVADIFFLENDEGVVLLPTDNDEKLSRMQDAIREIIKECTEEVREKTGSQVKVRIGVSSAQEEDRKCDRLILDARVTFKELYTGPERRRNLRRSYRIDVLIRTQGYETLSPKSVDISLGGLRLMSEKAIDVGSIHDMHMTLPGGFGAIFAKAIAVWARRAEDGLYTAGFKFLGMAQEDERRLRDFIYEGMRGFAA
jgi:hypothetical protein